MLRKVENFKINVNEYTPHYFHKIDRHWRESNCYVDLVIELLNQLKLNPTPGLAFTLATDFEGDQWTFFKHPQNDLFLLYGIDIQEMQIWRPLIDHTIEQIELGRPIFMEVDAFFLPDTSGTSYKNYHDKTTIGVQLIDPIKKKLGYFHGPGYYFLEEQDYDGIFDKGSLANENSLPLFAEIVKLDKIKYLKEKELNSLSLEIAKYHFNRIPQKNPFSHYRMRMNDHIDWLLNNDMDFYHKYAFSNLRQIGSSFEYLSFYLNWLNKVYKAGLEEAINNFESIARNAKVLMLKTVRVSSQKKTFDYEPIISSMEKNWGDGVEELYKSHLFKSDF